MKVVMLSNVDGEN